MDRPDAHQAWKWALANLGGATLTAFELSSHYLVGDSAGWLRKATSGVETLVILVWYVGIYGTIFSNAQKILRL